MKLSERPDRHQGREVALRRALRAIGVDELIAEQRAIGGLWTVATIAASEDGLVTPTFTLNFVPKTGSSTSRDPKYINGTATRSVKITLVSTNGNPTTVTNPTVTTDVNGASPTACNPTCTVPGPPSPPGTDRYTVTTYDATGGGGNSLSTASPSWPARPTRA